MNRKHCLVVDDSKIVRQICTAILKELGFTAVEAENGREALEYCRSAKPSVILLDWNMPVMDGLEFLKRFRALPDQDQTRVIVCTTENDVEKIEVALSAGADEYIMKPFDADIIRSKLQQVGLL